MTAPFVPTPAQLGDIIVTVLEGSTGVAAEQWRRAIGPVRKLPAGQNILSNWTVTPDAGSDDLRAIRLAIEVVRKEHPYIAA